jgi:hypothetical protein
MMPDIEFAILGVPSFHTADGTKSTHYDLMMMCTGDSLIQVISRAVDFRILPKNTVFLE